MARDVRATASRGLGCSIRRMVRVNNEVATPTGSSGWKPSAVCTTSCPVSS